MFVTFGYLTQSICRIKINKMIVVVTQHLLAFLGCLALNAILVQPQDQLGMYINLINLINSLNLFIKKKLSLLFFKFRLKNTHFIHKFLCFIIQFYCILSKTELNFEKKKKFQTF